MQILSYRKLVAFLFVVGFILQFQFASVTSSNEISNKPVTAINHNSLILHDLLPSSPIIINNNVDLSNAATSGSELVGDPYLIEGLNITTTSNQDGIMISGTSKFFVVQRNYINTGQLAGSDGIIILNVATSIDLQHECFTFQL